MKKHKKADAGRQSQKQNFHQEDLALKTAAQFFGGELLPLLGVKGGDKVYRPDRSCQTGKPADVPGFQLCHGRRKLGASGI